VISVLSQSKQKEELFSLRELYLPEEKSGVFSLYFIYFCIRYLCRSGIYIFLYYFFFFTRRLFVPVADSGA